MEIRRIKINSQFEVDTLKIFILQKLKLIDHKRNNLEEFETRLNAYLARNRGLILEFLLDKVQFEKDLRFHLKVSNIKSNSYPDNYEFGNPLTRWMFESTPLTEEQSKNKAIIFELKVSEEIQKINMFFEWIVSFGNGQINIVK